MKIKFKNIFLMIVTLTSFLFLILNFVFLEKIEVLADGADAIAIRIVSNPDHLSAQAWYEQQGFSGSPQSLIVDGYKAVRDGRTVYVSATNVITETNKLYTNIYLISYNQEADFQTTDIFGQILKNWKFNTNIIPSVGTCSISNKNCYENSDCLADYTCSFNKCVLKSDKVLNCILDSDCPSNLFCDSKKSKIVRDLDRLEKIIAVKNQLAKYYEKNNHYPILGAGTYLSHVALSVWPSWQNVFLSDIGANGIVDPINKLGSCADIDKKFDLDTCWNATNNAFLSTSTNYNYTNLALPGNSYIITYLTNANGSNYDLCAVMETAMSGINYSLASSTLADYSCSGVSSLGNTGATGYSINSAPYISEYSLTGESGREFKGFINAIDPEGNAINWSVSGSGFSTWSPNTVPSLSNTSNPNQKMLKAIKAGIAGEYPVTINLSDSLGSSSSKTINIKITNPGPQIIVGNISHNLSYDDSFSNSILITSNNSLKTDVGIKINFLSTLTCSGDNCETPCLDNNCEFNIRECSASSSAISIMNNLTACFKKETNNEYRLNINNSGDLTVGSYKYVITTIDNYNASTFKNFIINFTANDPIINFNNCPTIANLGDYYECGVTVSNTIEDSSISIISALPNGLSFDSSDNKIKGYLLNLGSTTIVAKATNQFGLSSEKNYNLNVVTDCGSALVKYDSGPWNYSGTIRNQAGYYKTALIGNQCWLSDNLNVGTQVTYSLASTSNNVLEKYCTDNSSIGCDAYGGLYTWAEALKLSNGYNNNNNNPTSLQGICPDGYRVPTDIDFYILEKKYSNSCLADRNGYSCDGAGTELKSGGSSEFDVLLNNGLANFWTSIYASNYYLLTGSLSLNRNFNTSSSVSRSSQNRANLFSIRCIKDIRQCDSDSDCSSLNTKLKCSSEGLCIFNGNPLNINNTNSSND